MEARVAELNTEGWVNFTRLLVGHFSALVDNISEPQRWNRYAYVLNNPLKYVDPDGLDALVVAFTDYKISVYGVRVPELGHAGIVIIDNDGKTTYYEYGRYDQPEQRGIVQEFDVPDLVMGSDGRPTEESLNNLMQHLSEKHGQNGTVSGAYYDTDQDLTNSMRNYAEKRESQNKDSNRESYDLTSRNCMTFTKDVLSAGGVALRNSSSSSRPNGEIENMRGGSYSVYGRTSNPGTPIYRPSSKGTTPAPNGKRVGS